MPMTVLQIIPALDAGGAEQACVDIAAALAKRGDRALVASAGGWRVQALKKAGAFFIKRDMATKNPVGILANALWLARLIRREGVDLVHARSRAPAWSARIACRMTSCPFVATFHAAYKFSSAAKRSYNAVMASADRVIAISPFVAAHVREVYGVEEGRLRVIDRGVDVLSLAPLAAPQENVRTLRRAWGLKDGEKAIVFPARLSPVKGHETLIRAVAALSRSKRPFPPVLLIGDDQGREAYLNRLKDLIQAEGLGDVVRIVGPCADMSAAYALALLVVQPSTVPEGFGRVPVEAQAAAVPVIASAIGAMQDTILDGRTGWLVAPEDVDAWAHAIDHALALPAQDLAAMGDAGRAHVCARYAQEKMVAETLAVYDELGAGGGR